ncbi:MAG TPA: HD domain-containing protein [Bacilli bacterium]|nr:HD domain-containing protein [Bacilli bacterium]
MDIIKKMENEIIKRSNRFEKKHGYNFWNIHIKFVVENAIILAKKYNADVEIVTLAAILHDIASITKEEYQEEHHIIGAEIAEKLLKESNYPKDKIALIKECILNHRGSRIVKKDTIEEVCLADADALAHFNNIPALFSLAYNKNKLSIEDGKKFVIDKLSRSYNKLSEQTKKDYKEKYISILNIIN